MVKPNFKVDWGFISELEGFSYMGYIPEEENTSRNKIKSGVTIASGIDLGQMGEGDLLSLYLPSSLYQKLSPYLLRRGEDAVNFLKAHPLRVTSEEAKILEEAVREDKLLLLEQRFNNSSTKEFRDLTAPQQTIIASVAFQYGDLGRRTPTFWGHVTDLDWESAIEELKDFGDSYKTRRNKEAKYLKEGL